MIVFVSIVQILMFYNVISFSHQFPDAADIITMLEDLHLKDVVI
jgi:hypothetical protein